MILSSEDLPVPLGPTTPILAPWRNERVTLSRTTLSPWALRTLRSVKTYSAMRASLRGAPPRRQSHPATPTGRLTRPGPAAPPRLRRRPPVRRPGCSPTRLAGSAAALGRVSTVVPCDEVVADDVASTSSDVCRLPSRCPRRRLRSRPWTTTGSPLASEAAKWSPRRRQALDGVPRGRAVDPLAVAVERGGVQATRKVATARPSASSRSVTSPPSQPWKVTWVRSSGASSCPRQRVCRACVQGSGRRPTRPVRRRDGPVDDARTAAPVDDWWPATGSATG